MSTLIKQNEFVCEVYPYSDKTVKIPMNEESSQDSERDSINKKYKTPFTIANLHPKLSSKNSIPKSLNERPPEAKISESKTHQDKNDLQNPHSTEGKIKVVNQTEQETTNLPDTNDNIERKRVNPRMANFKIDIENDQLEIHVFEIIKQNLFYLTTTPDFPFLKSSFKDVEYHSIPISDIERIGIKLAIKKTKKKVSPEKFSKNILIKIKDVFSFKNRDGLKEAKEDLSFEFILKEIKKEEIKFQISQDSLSFFEDFLVSSKCFPFDKLALNQEALYPFFPRYVSLKIPKQPWYIWFKELKDEFKRNEVNLEDLIKKDCDFSLAVVNLREENNKLYKQFAEDYFFITLKKVGKVYLSLKWQHVFWNISFPKIKKLGTFNLNKNSIEFLYKPEGDKVCRLKFKIENISNKEQEKLLEDLKSWIEDQMFGKIKIKGIFIKEKDDNT